MHSSHKGRKLVLVCCLLGIGPFGYEREVRAETNGEVVQTESEVLSTLSVRGVQLNQEFNANVKDYRASVGSDVTDIQLLAASDTDNAVITVNDNVVTGGQESTYKLITGENKFVIRIEGEEPVTYTLIVTKAQSSNSNLASLNLSKGALSFEESVTDYQVSVENSVSVLSVKPKAVDTTASIKVNNQVFIGTAISVKLPVGKTKIKIVVTAEDGTQKTYVLTVTRKAKTVNDDTESEPKSGTDTKTDDDTKSGNGDDVKRDNPSKGSSSAPTENTKSPSQMLSKSQQQAGAELAAKPTSELGSNQVESNENNGPKLSSLSISNGTWNKAFSSNEFTYHISVDTDVERVTLTTAADSNSTIKIEGKSSKTISLADAAKTILSVVVSKDDERSTYILVIEKDLDTAGESEVDSIDQTEASVSAVDVKGKPGGNRMNMVEGSQLTKESSSIWS
ncbi:cadherin-like beta sandwich domain-containing protein, partial [Peribacillus psychrosaccharolyticus]